MNWRPIETAPQDTGGKWEVHVEGDMYALCKADNNTARFPVSFDHEHEAEYVCEYINNLLAGHDLSQVAVVKREVVDEALQALRRAGGYAHFADAQETVKACKEAHDKLQASLNAGGADE